MTPDTAGDDATVSAPARSAAVHGDHGDAGLPPRQRRLAMLCVLVSSTMCVLATSLVTVALPTMARDMDTSAAASVWIVNAFQLAIAASILAFSGLGAAVGLRRVFMGGLTLFTAASLACALANALPLLVLLRCLQGLGAAAVICTSPAFFRLIHPPQALGGALGLNALVVATAMACGPIVGGMLVEHVHWRWLFAANLPIGLAALACALRLLPPGPRGHGLRRFDAAGAATSVLGVALLVLAADKLRQPQGLAASAQLLAAAMVATGIFIATQRAARYPLLPPDLLRNHRLVLASCTSVVANVGQGVTMVALPFLLQLAYGWGPAESGWLLTALPLGIMVAAPLSGWLSDRHGSALLPCGGLLLVALGLVGLATLGTERPPGTAVACRIFACGVGFGLFQTPNNREFIQSVGPARVSHAAGLLSFTRNIGLTLGATVVGAAMALQGGPTAALQFCLLAGTGAFLCASAIGALRSHLAKVAPP